MAVGYCSSVRRLKIPRSYLLDPGLHSWSRGCRSVTRWRKVSHRVELRLCHYSLDVDWDGKPDLKWAKPNRDDARQSIQTGTRVGDWQPGYCAWMDLCVFAKHNSRF